MKNRALALLLCLALLASLAGCFRIVPKAPEAAPAAEPAPAEAETEPAAPALPAEPEEAAEAEAPPAEPEEPAEAGGPEETEEPAEPETPPEESGPRYFREVWHGDADYSDLSYEHYEAARFDELTEPIYALARGSGNAEDFAAADEALQEELIYIYTLQTLAGLSFSADPSDDENYEEYSYSQDLFNGAWDEYLQAMHTLAVSPHAALLEERYDAELIEFFTAYEDDDGAMTTLLKEKNELIQDYYREMAKRRPDYDEIGRIYVALVDKANDYARRQGYESAAAYSYESIYSRDYTPADSEAVWAAVKQYIVPLVQDYGYDAWESADRLSRAWDLDCSPEAILAVMETHLPSLSPELYTAFRYMLDHGLCDLDYDEGKEETGYTTLLYSVNEPFIFNSPYGNFQDYTDTFHEFGHFTNYFYTESDLLFGLSDYDLSELQSQGLELLFTHYYPDIFGRLAKEAEQVLLMNMLYSLVDGSLYDEFQQRVYTEENLTPERVDEIYAELYREYGYNPYYGYEREWMQVSHNFEDPFYYISYGVSALGALELWTLAQEDWDAAVDRYLTACAMDTEATYYSEAIGELGLRDVFAAETYRDVAAAVREEFD